MAARSLHAPPGMLGQLCLVMCQGQLPGPWRCLCCFQVTKARPSRFAPNCRGHLATAPPLTLVSSGTRALRGNTKVKENLDVQLFKTCFGLTPASSTKRQQ